MSCEGDNLNKMPRDSFKTNYLFHSKRARESGITGDESGPALESVLRNTDFRRMTELDRFYTERFGVSIQGDLIRDFARFMERNAKHKRGFR